MTEPIPQEHRDAIATVFKSLSARVLKHLPQWDFALGEQQLATLKGNLKRMATDLGSEPFVLEITQADDSVGSPLTAVVILKESTTGITTTTLGKTLKVLRTRKITATSSATTVGPVEISEASEGTLLLWRATNDAVSVFADGQIVDYFDLKSPDAPPASASRFVRKAEDFEWSILDHYRCCVRYAERTDHWADRRRRKLRKSLGAAHKTELIFHRDLHHWLKYNLEAQVWSHPKDTSRDELDIIILAPNGRSYLIELKWMGTSAAAGESDFSYDITAIANGLEQLRTYLNKQPQIKRGALVTYDGRTEAEFNALTCIDGKGPDGCKRLDKCEGVAVPPRGSCMVLFLESKTASE